MQATGELVGLFQVPRAEDHTKAFAGESLGSGEANAWAGTNAEEGLHLFSYSGGLFPKKTNRCKMRDNYD
ncbi:hypothetical protein D3C80_2106890 [compost metagenome]